MHLRPDASTVRMVPWAADPTAQVIHDCYTKDGQPHELAPRNVLRRVLEAYAEVKLQPVVAPELEFFWCRKTPTRIFRCCRRQGAPGARKPHGSRIRSMR